jgi:mono/diheme cytochrome c family protein
MTLRPIPILAASALAAFSLFVGTVPAHAGSPAEASRTGIPAEAVTVERGRYVAKIAGCNDCHTRDYAPSGGTVPEAEWLKGDALGYNGPWGTTYAPNLRIFVSRLSEDQWVQYARSARLRPPMPWFALRDMNEADLRSLHRFVRSLGAPGEQAPAYLPPGVEPKGAYAKFVLPPPPAVKPVARTARN